MKLSWLWVICLIVMGMGDAWAAERFPPPEFSVGHELPETDAPGASPRTLAWMDVLLLAIGLGVASWLSLKRRSRVGLVWLSLLSVAYFGFLRQGCVCAIGSIQNVALGVADAGYAVSFSVIAFFALPLLFGLIWGRGFCAGVCPHGAIQELVLIKPLRVPAWLDEVLRLGPWLYLGLAVLFAATGGLFLICKFDPFIGVFRMAGSIGMLSLGAGMLVLSMFVGRPYCRYLCPYGALMGLAGRVSKWRPSVTPSECTQCRLCEIACPHGALRVGLNSEDAELSQGNVRRRLMVGLVIAPLAALLFAWMGSRVGIASMDWHPAGELAELVMMDDHGQLSGTVPDALVAFQQNGGSRRVVYEEAARAENRAMVLGAWIGGFFGLVVVVKTGRAYFPLVTSDYETERGRCVSCARCFSSCPYERMRRGEEPGLMKGGADV